MSPLRYHLYVFDFDGTLANSRAAVVATYNATLAALGLPREPTDRIAARMGLPLATCFEQTGLPPTRVPTAVADYRQRFETVGKPLVAPFGGVLDTLAELHRRGAHLAVASSRGRASLRSLVAGLGMARWFDAVVGEEDVARKKPDPQPVLRILERLRIGSDRTVVVGDTVYDLAMGRAAGCATCGVT